jgi:hypothetical protein
VDSLGIAASSITGALPAIDGSALTNLSAGKVLQVVQTATDTQIVSTAEGANVDLMSVSITPTTTTSKFLISLSAIMGSFNPNGGLRLYRDSTSIGDASSGYSGSGFITMDEWVVETGGNSIYALDAFSWQYLDTPASTTVGTPITFKLTADSISTLYFNRASNSSTQGYGNSTITVMEIAQ